MLNIEELFKILPHRYPFLMIDRVLEIEPMKKVVAIKNVSFNEEFFSGHFPGRPVMPGALIIEAMAQASILLFYAAKNAEIKDKKIEYYLGGVKMKFREPVVPGDILKITVEPLKLISAAGIVKAEASVGDKLIAEGEISFAVKVSDD